VVGGSRVVTRKHYELIARAAGLSPEELDAHYERAMRRELSQEDPPEGERLLIERIAGARWMLRLMEGT
jgi:hypothetical protein